MSQQLLTYGLQNNKLTHISEVANGLSCNCICPYCKQTLVAKNNPSNKKEAHFAHYSTIECDGAIETALHLLAKNVLLKTKSLFLPDYHYDYNPNNEWSIYNEGKTIIFDEILLEKSIAVAGEQIIPDAIGVIKNKEVLIEFANTHFVDEDKKRKIKKSNLPCVEINLKEQMLDEKKLFDFLNSSSPLIYWVTNPRFDVEYRQIKEQEKKRKIQHRQKVDKVRKEAPLKLEVYKKNKNFRVLSINNSVLACPKKIKNLQNSNFYANPLLKSIIDGEFWNGVIYKDYRTLEESIYLQNKKITLHSQEVWKGLTRMQCEIPDWNCDDDVDEDEQCNYCECKTYYGVCCLKCNFFVEKIEVDFKRYVICKFH